MDILMPQLGETVTEGTITTWYKTVGDIVAAGDSLFEIETDKTSMEVPTSVAGVLSEIRVEAGKTVPVGTIVAVLGAAALGTADTKKANGAAAGSASAAGSAPAAKVDPFNAVRTPEKTFGPATLANGVKATPVARRLAVQGGVDIATVKGSGPHGRVVAKDVKNANGRPAPVRVEEPSPAVTLAASATSAQVKALFADVPHQEIALDGMRKTIARRLLEAKQTVPHFYLSADVEMDKLARLRTEMNEQASGLFRLSVNDFIIKALAQALQRVPGANAVWAEDRILQFAHSDVGVAVAVDGGLFTPIIRGAEKKSMSVLSNEMKSLAERARSKSLKPNEYQGGSISISNLGMYGVRSFSAIINPPQSAILAVGAADRRPLEAADGSMRFGSVMSVTLSCDHRVIDGALGAQLLGAFKDLMQTPLALLA
jgi:pyruvate dehydrogenase E2 component (dihydrolipoamide acetyltransferase)